MDMPRKSGCIEPLRRITSSYISMEGGKFATISSTSEFRCNGLSEPIPLPREGHEGIRTEEQT
jgi:hypothetical protein